MLRASSRLSSDSSDEEQKLTQLSMVREEDEEDPSFFGTLERGEEVKEEVTPPTFQLNPAESIASKSSSLREEFPIDLRSQNTGGSNRSRRKTAM